MPRIRHKHRWQMVIHLDGCHYFASTYSCTRCSHTLKAYNERNPSEDPYSMIWMEPSVREVRRDEKGRFITPRYEEVRCERCEELQQGAASISAMEIDR